MNADRASAPLFILGAGPGIGASVARRFGSEGQAIGLIARNRGRLEEMVGALRESGIEAALAVADANDPGAVTAAVDELIAELGLPEALCVSPLPDLATIKPIEETGVEDLRSALALGVLGTAAAVEAVLGGMRVAGRGTLLFTSGSAALNPNPERATSGIVNAAQSTYIQMLHDRLGGEGIYALHTVIVGPIGEGGHDPDEIADAVWDAAAARADEQIVIR